MLIIAYPRQQPKYDTDAMTPVEVGEPSTRRLFFQAQQNEENMKVELEMKDGVQKMARINEEATKLWASRRYNTKVQPQAWQPNMVSLTKI